MKIISVAGDRVAILLSGEQTGGQYTIMEAVIPAGGGPPPHVHHREDETFLVLTGEITIYLDGKPQRIASGQSLFAPRDIPHYFRNTGSEDARVLEIGMPAGIEKFFEAVGHEMPGLDSRPVKPTPEDIARMRALAPQYGIDILA